MFMTSNRLRAYEVCVRHLGFLRLENSGKQRDGVVLRRGGGGEREEQGRET